MFKLQRLLVSKVIECTRHISQRVNYTDDSVIPIDSKTLFIRKTNADISQLEKQIQSLERNRNLLKEQINETVSILSHLVEVNILYPPKADKEPLPGSFAILNATTLDDKDKMSVKPKDTLKANTKLNDRTQEEEQGPFVKKQQSKVKNAVSVSTNMPKMHNTEMGPTESPRSKRRPRIMPSENRQNLLGQKGLLAESEINTKEEDEMTSELDIQKQLATTNAVVSEKQGFELEQNYEVQIEPIEPLKGGTLPEEMHITKTRSQIVQHTPNSFEEQVMAFAEEYGVQLKPKASSSKSIATKNAKPIYK